MPGYLVRWMLPALAALALLPRSGWSQSPDLVALYEEREIRAVLTALPDSMFPDLALEDQLLHLLTDARRGAGQHAAEQLAPVLAARPDDPAVLATAAVVHHAAGDLETAARLARSALDADPGQVEAWRADAMLRLHHHDGDGALASYRESRRAAPERTGSVWDLILGVSIAEQLADGGIRADVHEARARALEAAGATDEAMGERKRAALYRTVAGLPFFTATTRSEMVVLPFGLCSPGSPYRCVQLRAEDAEYQVLLDSGNEYGFGVHSPALRVALASHTGGGTTVTTGSVDTAFAATDLFADSLLLGDLVLHHVPGLASLREPARYDANLNPFFIRGRVLTLDYVTNRLIVRTKARFDRDMESATAVARVPVYDLDRPYVRAMVNGRPATAVLETGAETLSLTSQFAGREALPLREGTRKWGSRMLDVRRTDVDVEIGGMPFFSDSVEVWPGRVFEGCTGLVYDVVIGPGSLDGRFSLSYDPFDRVVVVEPGAARHTTL